MPSSRVSLSVESMLLGTMATYISACLLVASRDNLCCKFSCKLKSLWFFHPNILNLLFRLCMYWFNMTTFGTGLPFTSIMVVLSTLYLCSSSIDNVFRYSIMTSFGISSDNLPAKIKILASSFIFFLCSSTKSALTNASTPSFSSKASSSQVSLLSWPSYILRPKIAS